MVEALGVDATQRGIEVLIEVVDQELYLSSTVINL
jgi:hypothetical protein